MVCFDQYKIEMFDFEMFNKEYGENKKYLWDINENVCPKDKFFIVNGCKFDNRNSAKRDLIESSHKEYSSKIEYTIVSPTDTYVVFDFYLHSLHEKIDISYILSEKEFEIYQSKLKTKDFLNINNRFYLNKKIYFVIFINSLTRETIYQLIISNNDYELEDHINYFKIMGFYAKAVISKKEMDLYTKEYKKYTSGKINKKERAEIEELLNMPFIGKNSKLNLIEFIEVEIERRLTEHQRKEPENEAEFIQREYNFLSAKKAALLNYKSLHENYQKKMKEKEILEDDGFYIENMLDEITLYRHSKDFFRELLDLSFESFVVDKDLIDKEYIKVYDELESLNKERATDGF